LRLGFTSISQPPYWLYHNLNDIIERFYINMYVIQVEPVCVCL